MVTHVGYGRSWLHRLVVAGCVLAPQMVAFAAQRQTAGFEGTVQDASGTLVRHHFQRAVLRAARERIERTP